MNNISEKLQKGIGQKHGRMENDNARNVLRVTEQPDLF